MLSQLAGAILILDAALAISEVGERFPNSVDASIEDYPYVVSIRYQNGFHFCGGTIVNEYWILTTAYCLSLPSNLLTLSVQVGRTLTSTSVDSSIYAIDWVIVHPKYDRANNKLNDIALIKLTRPLVFCNNVAPVRLASEDFVPSSRVTTVGWGEVVPGGPVSTTLRQLDYFVVPNKECKNRYSCVSNIYASHLCAAFPGGEKAASFGDWGGPLLYNGIQIGILSTTYADKSRFPDIYTKVSDYFQFINNSIPKTHVHNSF